MSKLPNQPNSKTNLVPVSFTKEVRQRFLDYALSVIISRALPNVADGLKPVHRRILYAMHQLKLTANRPYKKSARIVGEVIGKYHPHGDVAVYDAMVKMIQPFASYYPLISGHGNFGSIDGDSPAAMRYTEVRLSELANAILDNIQYNTVDFIDNYDSTEREPIVLPGLLPNLLLNGSTGIAVGMATNIPPHNLHELIDGIIAYLKNPALTFDELCEFLKGPDFPTGCDVVLTHKNQIELFKTGRGKLKIRAKYKIENYKNHQQIVFYEIPYQVNKTTLIQGIIELVRAKKINGISDLKDESNRLGIRLILRLKKDVQIDILLNKLFKYTSLQVSYSVNLIALHNNKPQLMNYLQVFNYYVEHQIQIITRRTEFLLKQAQTRLLTLSALTKALAKIDQVIAVTKASSTAKIAQTKLQNLLQISELQAKSVLEMKLQRLTSLEQENLFADKLVVEKAIVEHQTLLKSEANKKSVLIKKLLDLKNRFKSKRKSRIIRHDIYANLQEINFINHKNVLICLSENNYVKRVNTDLFSSQKRGGIGVRGMLLNEKDNIKQILFADTHDRIMFFTDLGKVYALPTYKIPDLGRNTKGTPAQNLIKLQPGEKIRSMMKIENSKSNNRIFFVTVKGLVKQTLIHHFKNINSTGKIAIKLNPNDNLAYAFVVCEDENIILSKNDNLIVRFLAKQIRATGRATKGMIGVRSNLKNINNLRINGASSALADQKILSVDNLGFGKMSSLSNYRLTKPGAKGVMGVRRENKIFSRSICTTIAVSGNEELLIAKSNGKLIISSLQNTRITQSRSARGVKLVKLEPGERITTVAILPTNTAKKK